MEKTPKASDELTLLQAGMGRRTITVKDDSDHSWLSRKLEETYPKMTDLNGAWMLYKAVGGSGQRKLCIVPPEAEGYTGAYLSSVARGKSALYIVPVQGTLDMSPLPYSSKEFEKMPKTTCRNCYENMPVQFLAAHVASCKTVTLSDEETTSTFSTDDSPAMDITMQNSPDNTSSIETSVTDTNNLNLTSCAKGSETTACPICEQLYPSDTVEFHASYCGERVFDETEAFDTDRTEICPKRLRTQQEIKSIADVIKSLTERVDESSTFSICVTREQMVERGIKQWQRQKKSSPKNALRVTFIGEAGIDNGALKTEFLTEMMSGIEKRFFEGGDGGKNPKYSITDLDKHNFKVIGEIFAVSIAQGGPPPNFFSQWCYKYISTGEVDQEAITERDITDPEVLELIKEIKAADNTTVMEFTDRILSCGYTGAVSFEKKKRLCGI
ncbi:uncharacterized protein [Chanodichthys erythropterus]